MPRKPVKNPVSEAEGETLRANVTLREPFAGAIKRWAAAWGGQSPASIIAFIVSQVLTGKEISLPCEANLDLQGEETLHRAIAELELLRGFLRCLAENWDTDGFSVAEIGRLLGFNGNFELDRLIEVLEKAKEQSAHEEHITSKSGTSSRKNKTVQP